MPTASGARPHLVTLTNPANGPGVPDGDGGYLPPAPQPLEPPTVYARIATATTAALESISAGGSVLAKSTHLAYCPFHPQVSSLTRVDWTDAAGRPHTASVTGVVDPDQRARELIVGLVEVVE